jgi:hypothetical protein
MYSRFSRRRKSSGLTASKKMTIKAKLGRKTSKSLKTIASGLSAVGKYSEARFIKSLAAKKRRKKTKKSGFLGLF